jgi:uncharacterized membrane protein
VRFANPLPWWGLLPIIALLLLVSIRSWTRAAEVVSRPRRTLLVAIRAVSLLLLLALLMRPVIVRPALDLRDAVVAVLIDGSRSMQLRDVSGRARIEEAVDIVRRHIVPAFARRLTVEPFMFGDQIVAADLNRPQAGGTRSDLAGALREVPDRVRGRTLAGIVVVSDGAVSEPLPGTAQAAPVYAIGVGSPSIARDREVASALLGDVSVTESVADLAATVVSRGYGTSPFDVRLLEDGKPADVRRVRPASDGSPVSITFRVTPRRDRPTVYSVDITAAPDELTPGNNRFSVLATPPARPRRVLMVQGAPGFDHSFLKRALEEDRGVQVDAVVRKGQNDNGQVTYYVQADPQRAPQLTGGFPATREALFAFDALVLANFGVDALRRDQLDAVRAFVAERGGGLIVLGTRSFDPRVLAGTPLEEMLPLRLTGEGTDVQAASASRSAELSVTPDGEQHPLMRLGAGSSVTDAWQQLPGLASIVRLGGPRPGAAVLAFATSPGGGSRPVVAIQRYGRGRVLAFTGEASFRWKMMLPSSDRRYETFWRQAVRWVAVPASDPVSLDAVLTSRDSAEAEVTVRDAAFNPVRNATVAIRVNSAQPGAQEQTAALQDAGSAVYATSLHFNQPGAHRVDAIARQGRRELGRSSAWVLSGGIDPELVDPRRNDDVLRRIATANRGRLLEPSEISKLPGLLRPGAHGNPPMVQQELWDSPWVFALLAGLLCVEWVLRRRWGLR